MQFGIRIAIPFFLVSGVFMLFTGSPLEVLQIVPQSFSGQDQVL